MAKKNDLKNSMSAGLTGGLDSLIQSTAGQKEAQKPKKAKTVHCNFVMDETYHQNLKLIAIRKGDSLKSVLQEAISDYLDKNKKVCQNAHLLFFTHKAPTFTSWGFVIT